MSYYDPDPQVLKEALPIKCIEAVFLGALLSAPWSDVTRHPLGFKSSAGGLVHRHIVLVVHHPGSGQWGALGISRNGQEDRVCLPRIARRRIPREVSSHRA